MYLWWLIHYLWYYYLLCAKTGVVHKMTTSREIYRQVCLIHIDYARLIGSYRLVVQQSSVEVTSALYPDMFSIVVGIYLLSLFALYWGVVVSCLSTFCCIIMICCLLPSSALLLLFYSTVGALCVLSWLPFHVICCFVLCCIMLCCKPSGPLLLLFLVVVTEWVHSNQLDVVDPRWAVVLCLSTWCCIMLCRCSMFYAAYHYYHPKILLIYLVVVVSCSVAYHPMICCLPSCFSCWSFMLCTCCCCLFVAIVVSWCVQHSVCSVAHHTHMFVCCYCTWNVHTRCPLYSQVVVCHCHPCPTVPIPTHTLSMYIICWQSVGWCVVCDHVIIFIC
jgi:hypothetical protein